MVRTKLEVFVVVLKAFNILKLGNKPIKKLATFLTEGTGNKVVGG